MTAIANDYGFAHVFARQVEGLGRSGDIALAISTSGSSANVLAGVEAARRAGLATIGLCGAPGCLLCEAVDIAIATPAGETARVQELHLAVEHTLCRAIEHLPFRMPRNLPRQPPWARGFRTLRGYRRRKGP